MRVPFGKRPARGDDKTRVGGGSFELLRRPALERAAHRGLVVSAAEQRQQAVTVMRQIRMQPRPAAVAAAVQPGDAIVMIVKLFAVDPQITFAAKFDRRVAHFDAHPLAASAAQPPQFGGGERRGADRRLCRRPDRKG